MSDTATIEGKENIPGEPLLVIPNRVDAAALTALEEALGGRTKVAWVIDNSLRPSAEVVNLLIKHQAGGFTLPPAQAGQELLLKGIRAMLTAGRHVVLLPGRPTQPPAAEADVMPELLHRLLDAYPHAVLPVYVGMYRLRPCVRVTTESPYDKMVVSICPALRAAGEVSVSGVRAAWLEAAADQAAQLFAPGAGGGREAGLTTATTLSQALLQSLTAHPNALIVDGVDNKQMTYRQLLVRAATLARQLRLHVANKRIGIILPPGKYSVIANVACLLAGIIPVNIDYNYGSATYESVSRQAELDRLITENRFIEMQADFPWPLTRDILFIDALPDSGNQGLPLKWRLWRSSMTPAHVAKWIRTPEDTDAQQEAVAIFSPAMGGGQVRGTVLSHRAVLAGAVLTYSRFCLQPGQRVLSALPFYHPAGLLQGLLYPLLMGQDIITYSLPEFGRRLGELARRYRAELAVFTPKQAMDVLSGAAEGDFETTSFFLVAGKVTEQEYRSALRQHRVQICECYHPQECAMPLACNMPQPEAEESAAPSLAFGDPGSVGRLMPGVALRITDLDDPLRLQPLHVLGLVWARGAGIASLPPVQAGSSAPARPAHERWFCTGEVGRMTEDGLLVVHGPRSRFSQIEGEIIFHGEVEKLMAKYLRAEPEPGEPPRLAVIGVQDEQTGEDRLILLSTVHKVLGPHDIITLHYALSNDHRSTRMTPARIVPLRAIPTLPDGRVDYTRCMSLYRYISQS